MDLIGYIYGSAFAKRKEEEEGERGNGGERRCVCVYKRNICNMLGVSCVPTDELFRCTPQSRLGETDLMSTYDAI